MKSPVLLYHKIDHPTEDVKIRGAFTSPRRFEIQMSYLKRHGFRFFTASELARRCLEDGRFPERGVCVTFDDGWKDNYTHAFPILRKLSIPATIFLVPACIGETTARVTAEGEGPREHMSAEDVREMAGSGIEFGSHSMNHRLFDRIDEIEIESEIRESKSFVENLVQRECGVFAYPAGFYTNYAKEAVARAGYIAAFTTVYGPTESTDRYALNRTEILRRDRFPFRFSRKVKALVTG